MTAILERHAGSIQSTLSCFDRLLVQGTVVDIGHPDAIRFYFNVNRRRIFDFKEWAKPYRERIHDDVKAAAAHAGLKVEFVKRPNSFRKEDRIAEILKTRGTAPGVVHVFEVMENCMTYEPWHDKASHRTYFRTHGGKCAHYYVYFIDEELGLCHLRIPTWAPFRLQFCLNGHNWLANELTKAGITFSQVDNAFVSISDVEAAQFIANGLAPKKLHRRLDDAVRRFAPALRDFKSGIHWSLMQVEYSTDLVFSDAEVLKPMYEEIVRTLVHAVQPEQVAMFLGKRLDPRFEGELGSSFVRRTQGLCLRHFMSSSGIKIYDKFGHILRIECFTNDVNFFKHHRRVEHRDGTYSYQTAPVRKSIYSLGALSKIMGACNKRYLAFLGAVDDPTNGIHAVEKISARVREGDRTYRGFNMFNADDLAVVRAVAQAHLLGFGFRNRHVRQYLPHKNSSQIARAIKRLRTHGIVKKVAGAFRYYLTTFGQAVVASALKLKEMFLVPSLRGHLATP